jgi:protein-S-isoprenylcysteine O-methyltransferase Ste14
MGKVIMVRNEFRKDILFFVLPGLFVLISGGGVCVWDLVRRQESFYLWSVQNVVGLVLTVIGLAINWVAAGTLRRNYSSSLVIREGHQLITHGIYRFTRNPVYLGALMVLLGMPIFISSLYGFLVMAVLIPLVLNRIRIEEGMLEAEFGEAYRTYQKATRKLIPFVY